LLQSTMSDTDDISVVSVSSILRSSYVVPNHPNTSQDPGSTTQTPDNNNNATSPIAETKTTINPDRAAKPLPETLKLVLPATSENENDRYAVISFPKTYKDATLAVVKVLGRYMLDPTPENTILRCSTKNRKGEWVWADIPPQDWDLMMRQFGSEEIGVFQARKKILEASLGFVHGYVYLTVGEERDSEMRWTKVGNQFPLMNRPKNYKEAVKLTTHCIKEKMRVHAHFLEGLQQVDQKTFHFYSFVNQANTNGWTAFPETAYTDDDIWRARVPALG